MPGDMPVDRPGVYRLIDRLIALSEIEHQKKIKLKECAIQIEIKHFVLYMFDRLPVTH